jgi:predicted transcriptional regulator
MRVQDVMTDRGYRVGADTSAEDAWNIMRMRRIHHLIVVVSQAGRTVGLLSARDFSELKGRILPRLCERILVHLTAASTVLE